MRAVSLLSQRESKTQIRCQGRTGVQCHDAHGTHSFKLSCPGEQVIKAQAWGEHRTGKMGHPPLTCSIICRTFRCWLLSMSSKWWIFSRNPATSFSRAAVLGTKTRKRGEVTLPPSVSPCASVGCPKEQVTTTLEMSSPKEERQRKSCARH